MSEETLKSVKTVSDGSVTITVEKYQELVAKAAEKIPVVHKVIQKTDAMVAADNKLWGVSLIIFGGVVTVIGGIIHSVGRTQDRRLSDVK